jgi:hypothetical protein
MRPITIRTFITCSLLLTAGLVANAQQYPPQQYPPQQQRYPPQPYPNDPSYQQGNPYERGPYGEPRYQAPPNGAPAYSDYASGLFDRVQADLARAAYNSYRSQDRFEHARHEVYEFQVRLSRGRFDRGRLDHAIEAVQHAADTRWIRDRDRAGLLDDANRMREFRVTQGGSYSPRPYEPGYRY